MGLSAHSPVRPSWPQVRMSPCAPRPSEGVHLKPRIPAVRWAPKIPSSCATVSFPMGLSLWTKTTSPLETALPVEGAGAHDDVGGRVPVHLVEREALGERGIAAEGRQVGNAGHQRGGGGVARRQMVL